MACGLFPSRRIPENRLLEGAVCSRSAAAVAQTGRALGLLFALEARGHRFDQGTRHDDRFDFPLTRQQGVGEHDDQQQQDHQRLLAERQQVRVVREGDGHESADHDGECQGGAAQTEHQDWRQAETLRQVGEEDPHERLEAQETYEHDHAGQCGVLGAGEGHEEHGDGYERHERLEESTPPVAGAEGRDRQKH